MKISIKHETSRYVLLFTEWIKQGCPLLPKRTMDTRSPSFVLLILIIALIGMAIPEIFGLINPHPISLLL